MTSRHEQPTTIGELDGRRSERISAIASALGGAGFPVSICADMDAWLKTHVAKILSTAGALSYAGGHAEQLTMKHAALRLMVRAILEGFGVLRAKGISIVPTNHRVLLWLPEPVIVFIMKRMFSGKTIAIKVGHVEHARRELRLLAKEFRSLNAATRLPTPAMDRLLTHLGCAAPPQPGFVTCRCRTRAGSRMVLPIRYPNGTDPSITTCTSSSSRPWRSDWTARQAWHLLLRYVACGESW
jgi:2-dehydropantoate 2-reductase